MIRAASMFLWSDASRSPNARRKEGGVSTCILLLFVAVSVYASRGAFTLVE